MMMMVVVVVVVMMVLENKWHLVNKLWNVCNLVS
jgi:hypothetical protein